MWTNVVFYHNNCEAIASDNFHEIKPNNKKDLFVILGLLNSSITQLICEIIGRSYGGGVLQLKVYETKTIPILDPSKLTQQQREKVENKFKELSEIPFSDKNNFDKKKKELDDVIFDILGLTKDERKQVYEALDEALKLRIQRKEKKVLVE